MGGDPDMGVGENSQRGSEANVQYMAWKPAASMPIGCKQWHSKATVNPAGRQPSNETGSAHGNSQSQLGYFLGQFQGYVSNAFVRKYVRTFSAAYFEHCQRNDYSLPGTNIWYTWNLEQ